MVQNAEAESGLQQEEKGSNKIADFHKVEVTATAVPVVQKNRLQITSVGQRQAASGSLLTIEEASRE